LGAFSRSDIVTNGGWGYLDAEYQLADQGDMSIYRVFAPEAEDGSFVLRYLVLTPAIYEELTEAGYTHLEFVMGDASIMVPFSAFAGLVDWPVAGTTFILMLDVDGDGFIAGAYALDDEALGGELADIFELLAGLSLKVAVKAD